MSDANLSIKPITTHQKSDGRVTIGSVDLVKLTERFDTPLYGIDEETLRKNCRQFTQVLTQIYPQHEVVYAAKAGMNVGLLNVLASEGMGVDVVSLGELATALKSTIPREKILLHGNNKSRQEHELAIQYNIRIAIDNLPELHAVLALAKEMNQTARILLRLKPEVYAHTHHFIQTGGDDSKFGLAKDLIPDCIKAIKAGPHIEFLGIHGHIGSQIFDHEPYELLVDRMAQFMTQFEEAGLRVNQLNLGGGFGVSYVESDDPKPISIFLNAMIARLKSKLLEKGLAEPKVIVEPGRSIIANAGFTLYRLGAVKKAGDTQYVFIDGGMADNIRPLLYQSKHTLELANRADAPTERYTIAGKFCESGDKIAEGVHLPKLNEGDLLVVYGTGAYNYSMSSNYNRFCKPAMVMLNAGKAGLLVRRETVSDLLDHDVTEPVMEVL